MKKNIAVIIRVYDRIEDLKYNVQIINDLWKEHNYKIFIVFNGKSNGYILDSFIENKVEKIITLDENAGHLEGNSQLLLEGMKYINLNLYDNLIILEADTWIMGDKLITKYIDKLNYRNAVWASSEWVENRYSVGVDFAIIDAKFISEHYKNMFKFTTMAEMWMAEYMLSISAKFIFIKELMPVHRPSLIKAIYNADGGRIRVFPFGNMVTHHIENLNGGLEKKKELADIVYKNNYFTNNPILKININHFLYKLLNYSLMFIPKSSWIKNKKRTFLT